MQVGYGSFYPNEHRHHPDLTTPQAQDWQFLPPGHIVHGPWAVYVRTVS